jgi:hypothetical protein
VVSAGTNNSRSATEALRNFLHNCHQRSFHSNRALVISSLAINVKQSSSMPLVNREDFLKSKLDYIIVGGGTAGLVLAARFVHVNRGHTRLANCMLSIRLSEDPSVKVGVIEAGASYLGNVDIDTPGKTTNSDKRPVRLTESTLPYGRPDWKSSCYSSGRFLSQNLPTNKLLPTGSDASERQSSGRNFSGI